MQTRTVVSGMAIVAGIALVGVLLLSAEEHHVSRDSILAEVDEGRGSMVQLAPVEPVRQGPASVTLVASEAMLETQAKPIGPHGFQPKMPALSKEKKDATIGYSGGGWGKINTAEIQGLLKHLDNQKAVEQLEQAMASKLMMRTGVTAVIPKKDNFQLLKRTVRARREHLANVHTLCGDEEACDSIKAEQTKQWELDHKEMAHALAEPKAKKKFLAIIQKTIQSVSDKHENAAKGAKEINQGAEKVFKDIAVDVHPQKALSPKAKKKLAKKLKRLSAKAGLDGKKAARKAAKAAKRVKAAKKAATKAAKAAKKPKAVKKAAKAGKKLKAAKKAAKAAKAAKKPKAAKKAAKAAIKKAKQEAAADVKNDSAKQAKSAKQATVLTHDSLRGGAAAKKSTKAVTKQADAEIDSALRKADANAAKAAAPAPPLISTSEVVSSPESANQHRREARASAYLKDFEKKQAGEDAADGETTLAETESLTTVVAKPKAATAAKASKAAAAKAKAEAKLKKKKAELKVALAKKAAASKLKAQAKLKKKKLAAQTKQKKGAMKMQLKMTKVKTAAKAALAKAVLKKTAAQQNDVAQSKAEMAQQKQLQVLKVKENAAKKGADVKEKAQKKTLKVKTAAKMKAMRSKEKLTKKKRIMKDPAAKRLRKQERAAAREVRQTTQHLARQTRRLNRRAKYSIRQMRAHVQDRVHAQEQVASKVVRQEAKKLGVKTTPTVHFKLNLPKLGGNDADGAVKQTSAKPDSFVPLKFASPQMVADAKEAFSPGEAHSAASHGVAMAEEEADSVVPGLDHE